MRDRDRRGAYSRLEQGLVESALALGLAPDLDPSFGGEDWSWAHAAAPPWPPAQHWGVLLLGRADGALAVELERRGRRVGPMADFQR